MKSGVVVIRPDQRVQVLEPIQGAHKRIAQLRQIVGKLSDDSLFIGRVDEDKIIVNAIDRGPGIPDIEKAMKPGFSTAPDWIREMGFGAGMGLPNIKKCADEMRIESRVGEGTNLEFAVNITE